MGLDNIQHLPSQGESKENALMDPWLGQSTNDILEITVPSLLVPSLLEIDIPLTAESAVVSHEPVPMCPKLVQSFRGKSGGGRWNFDDSSSQRVYKLMSLRSGSHLLLEFGTWCWYREWGSVHMNRGECEREEGV
jgi:hypothetical protein